MMGKSENCNRFRVDKWMWEVCEKFRVWVVLRWGGGGGSEALLKEFSCAPT